MLRRSSTCRRAFGRRCPCAVHRRCPNPTGNRRPNVGLLNYGPGHVSADDAVACQLSPRAARWMRPARRFCFVGIVVVFLSDRYPSDSAAGSLDPVDDAVEQVFRRSIFVVRICLPVLQPLKCRQFCLIFANLHPLGFRLEMFTISCWSGVAHVAICVFSEVNHSFMRSV
jgi:hypothetical protein